MGKKIRGKMDDDDELEMLLDEIPQATSHNLLFPNRHRHVYGGDGGDDDDHGGYNSFVTHSVARGMHGMYDDDTSTQIKYSCASSSPLSGFSMQSDGSSSSLFSSGNSLSDNGSPTPPPLEELKSGNYSGSFNYPNSFWLDSKMPDLTVRKKANESLVDELDLCANLSNMYISNQQENSCNLKHTSMGMNEIPFRDCSWSGNDPINVHKHGGSDNFRREFFENVGVQSPFPKNALGPDAEMNSAFSGFSQDYKMANLFGSRQSPRHHETMVSQLPGFAGSMDSSRHRRRLINNYYYRGSPEPELAASMSGHAMADSLLYRQQNRINLMEERGVSRLHNSCCCSPIRPCSNVQNLLHYGLHVSNGRTVPHLNTKIPQGGLDAISSEGSFIIQGEGLNYVVNRGFDRSRSENKGAFHGTGFAKNLQRSELDIQHQGAGVYENPKSARMRCPFPFLPQYSSLAEVQGCIYSVAKDQHGCRFLQRKFEEGRPEEVQVIFNEIINHVAELMMNSFGNYLMQKLLEVCDEEQRMQIIFMVTQEPGQLVRISLNTHGTRVVQKLIETLKTRQQISLVVSALEPGFLALIKDLNGNHVVQRCLQCLSNEDNKFIFVAAAKYCVEIATHQHGCCVLQRCIDHSTREHRENLVAEISANALPLAQDQYGNYVVQFILDLRILPATANIILQFEGNYVHLSSQKFSSHVVEKCLAVFNDDNRSRIIYELLSTPHFEQLLQDPHANYVIQSALRHSEGHAHNLLVEEIESHKAISRNSPYSKKIFSQKLLKK